MIIDLKVPEVGESITEVEIGDWLKSKGDPVKKDETVVTLESSKATVELPAPESGVLKEILKEKGETAAVGETIAHLEEGGEAPATSKSAQPPPRPATAQQPAKEPERRSEQALERKEPVRTAPAERREEAKPPEPAPAPRVARAGKAEPGPAKTPAARTREEEVIPMSRLRRTVAERLVEAQRSSALLTTFNEIDMAGVIALRKDHGEAFQQKYNVKLGFMSFFVKAAIDALKQFPTINAEVRGTDIVYHNYFDIGVAIGSGKGLVVPVLRNAERMSFAEVELAIGDFARRVKENKIKVEDFQGGTFTITNGGVYGSLLSTPIINPPQSGILGMHTIQERPVAREGQVVIRPMMYVALTYDHRIVDGREAVSFLRRIKEAIENPARMLIEV